MSALPPPPAQPPPSPSDDTTQPGHPGWQKKKKTAPPWVVIVGAGFAGVAAAATLREGGVDDVTVLEAQDRPGGRVKTVQLDDGFVETGAQFIHGEKGNSLYHLAEDYRLLLDKSLYQNGQTSDSSAEDFCQHPFVTSDGQLFPQETTGRILSTINQIFRDYARSFYREENNELSSTHENVASGTSNVLLELNMGKEQSDKMMKKMAELIRGKVALAESGCLDGEKYDEDVLEMMKKLAAGKDGDIIQHDSGGAVEADGGKGEQNTFAEVLRQSRERILESGKEPKEIKLAFLKWMEQWEYTDNAARLQDISLPAYGKYGYIPGYGLTLTTSGIEHIFQVFLHNALPQQTLFLNTPVKTIFWKPSEPSSPEKNPGKNFKGNVSHKSNEGTEINRKNLASSSTNGEANEANGHHLTKGRSEHQNGDKRNPQQSHKPVKLVCENGEEFWADHVIVTPSMGYLQENEAAMFQPALPQAMRRAVQQMGFGVVAKVFVVWDDLHDVLGPHMNGVQLLWLDGQMVTPASDRSARKTKTGANWYDFLQGFERLESHKGALMTWLAGEEAEIMEQLPEEEVKDVLHELLAQFLGKPGLPRPKRLIRILFYSCVGRPPVGDSTPRSTAPLTRGDGLHASSCVTTAKSTLTYAKTASSSVTSDNSASLYVPALNTASSRSLPLT